MDKEPPKLQFVITASVVKFEKGEGSGPRLQENMQWWFWPKGKHGKVVVQTPAESSLILEPIQPIKVSTNQ